MLFSLSHGARVVMDTFRTGTALPPDSDDGEDILKRIDGIAPTAAFDGAGGTIGAATGAPLGYLFPEAAGITPSPATPAALDALGSSMATEAPDQKEGALPPILTCFAQFVSHDISAQADRSGGALSLIDGDLAPAPRDTVGQGLANLRDGALALDSLYGDGPGQGPFASKLARLMRHPILGYKMRLGVTADSGDGRPPLPADPAADLPRLGYLIDRGDVTMAEIQSLDPLLRAHFLLDGVPNRALAVIGDSRNDGNLILAQFHVAFLRLHNCFVDIAGSFEGARQLTRFHYQWLVVNDFLPAVCARNIVDEVVAKGAPLYARFRDRIGPSATTRLPVPLEFTAAAFRFGHSMVRARYDLNRYFGAEVAGTRQLQEEASFDMLLRMTGASGMRPAPDALPGSGLPGHWVLEWERFVDAETPLRAARKIDTHLVDVLDALPGHEGASAVMGRLAQRNLRRGYRLDLPTAQAAIAAINATGLYKTVPVLSPEEISAGRDFMRESGLDRQTPLWFYILREAELTGGNHLGALGSHIVANTLVGLVMTDPRSYWHTQINGHRWSPKLFRPEEPVDSMKAMLRFVGLLE